MNPLVTAVMITGMHEARYALARVAMRCFRQQTYPRRELLIVNHGKQSLYTGEAGVVELRIHKSDKETVGDLRNLALDHARGDFVICWDDDDWHAPGRIEAQLAAQKDDGAVVLRKQLRLNLLNESAFALTVDTGLAGTILHPRNVSQRYPSLVRGSDTKFMDSFRGRLAVMNNDPALYIRCYHGLNLWNAKHVMHRFANPELRDQLAVSEEQKQVIRQVLADNAGEYEQFHALKPAGKSERLPVTGA